MFSHAIFLIMMSPNLVALYKRLQAVCVYSLVVDRNNDLLQCPIP
jgi:hypothetical protein